MSDLGLCGQMSRCTDCRCLAPRQSEPGPRFGERAGASLRARGRRRETRGDEGGSCGAACQTPPPSRFGGVPKLASRVPGQLLPRPILLETALQLGTWDDSLVLQGSYELPAPPRGSCSARVAASNCGAGCARISAGQPAGRDAYRWQETMLRGTEIESALTPVYTPRGETHIDSWRADVCPNRPLTRRDSTGVLVLE